MNETRHTQPSTPQFTAPGPRPARPSNLELLFESEPVDLVDTVDEIVHIVERRDLGTLTFDALWIGDPFSAELGRLELPSDVPRTAEARSLVDRHGAFEDPAALALIFHDTIPREWRLASAGVATDCGIGGVSARSVSDFTDDERHALLERYEERDENALGVVLEDWILLSHTGYADGYYDAWWGIDDEDRICCLAVDFGLLEQEVVETERIALPLRRGTHRFESLPGVTLKVGFRRSQATLDYRLDQHFAYARLVTPEGEFQNPLRKSSAFGSGMKLDVSDARDGSQLEIRLVKGYEPMHRPSG